MTSTIQILRPPESFLSFIFQSNSINLNNLYTTTTSIKMLRTTLARSVRTFSTIRPLNKGPVEMGKDALKAADNVASKAAIKGLDAGEAAKDAIADAAGKVSGKAQQTSGETKGDASQLAGQAQGKAHELAGKAKGKAAEVEGEVKKATS